MEIAKIDVSRADARKVYCQTLTAGMAGVEVTFSFDDAWDGLHRIATFKAGGTAKDVLLTDDRCEIPPEVLAKPCARLVVGVYGERADGTLVIPTLWAELGRVEQGVTPSGDISGKHTPEVWAQIQGQIGNLEELDSENKETLVAAINEALRGGADREEIKRIVDEYLKEHGTGGTVKTVNGIAPDENGNVQIPVSGGNADQEQITTAINTALSQVKASGEFDGKDGADGKDGKDGYTPVKGVDYFDGQPGKDGVNGKDGTSATHSWNGTVLTITSASGTSSADLKGEKGEKGEQGIQGIPGEKGEKGDTGATGAQGEPGKDGEDYILTDADKEEIAGIVSIVKVAEPPEFVNDISECTDISKMYVLPNGHLGAYMTTEVTTEGSTVPNFTNIYNKTNGAYIKDGYRYSHSGGAFSAEAATCAVVVPVPGGSWKVNQQYTLRVQGATINGGTTRSSKIYTGTTNDTFPNSAAEPTVTTESDGTVVFVHTQNSADNVTTFSWLVFHVDDGVDENNLIVTFNEEITYITTEGGTETVTEWTDTGIEYNQPPDYADRVVAVEKKTAQLANDVDALENRVNNIGSGSAAGSGGMDAFSFAAYPPSPQLPGDGSDEADFNTANVATSEVYAYMDALWSRFRTYMTKQNLGKDSSGQYDYYRYVFSKAYWRAWYKENYPKMFAWINGSTVIYSESVSPRVDDTMYSTPYIGTAYSTVTAVNSETIGVASTRTVNGLVFTRHTDGDVEPTIVYTSPFAITANYMGRTYTDAFAASSSVKEFTHEYIVDNKDVKYYRYPFEDKKLDKSSLFPVFILANEHGNHGDSMIPSVTVMRMLKDLCSPTDNLFLKWLKENAIVTVIPLGNPYGGYNNANGVNINRNYDTPGWAGSDTDPVGGTKEDGAFGAYAGDQIETQYIMNTIQQCKAQTAVSYHGRGIPTGTLLGEYNSHGRFQGCGFDAERMWKVEEALFSMYNFGLSPDWHTIADDSSNNYLNAGKSPSYIEYAGAVGGLIEIDDYEVGTLDRFTPLAMEQAYAEVLLVLQNWVEEALKK